jgi:hypothetical protein
MCLGATPPVESASLRLKLFNFVEGSKTKVSHLKFGAAYLLLIFFNCEFFLGLFEDSFFFSFQYSNDYFLSIFLGVGKNVLEKICKNPQSKIITIG